MKDISLIIDKIVYECVYISLRCPLKQDERIEKFVSKYPDIPYLYSTMQFMVHSITNLSASLISLLDGLVIFNQHI